MKKISKKVFKLSFKISKFAKYSGNFIDQYNIWEKGKTKLKKNKHKQKAVAKKFFVPFKACFFLLPSFLSEWNLESFLKRLSTIKKKSTKIKSNRDKKLDVFKSSKINHELYISVVKVETPKYETVPKSDNVSIATKLRPMKIPGLAQGKIILKNLWYELKPKLFPRSKRFTDWPTNEVLESR